eukprot:TRINITY_DN2966_c0_g1_i3.p1 TRINITY_DN2966_c0_g1~~TRINITY_DN2966_c0_g1_i3.p1  ORF type:complete len:149 (-),score=20.35 TRINITY_DN2966_c0_g1_i3:187-633(-)
MFFCLFYFIFFSFSFDPFFLSFLFFFFFSSRRRHTRSCLVSWARRCVQETDAEYMGSHQLATLSGDSHLSFSYCTFVQWDTTAKEEYGITANNGELVLRGNEFVHSAPQVQILKGTKKAIVIGNLLTGSQRFEVNGETKTSIYGNVSD